MDIVVGGSIAPCVETTRFRRRKAASTATASAESLLSEPRTLGLLFESLCVRDLRVYAQTVGGTVYHYRDETGLEVDAIIERADQYTAF